MLMKVLFSLFLTCFLALSEASEQGSDVPVVLGDSQNQPSEEGLNERIMGRWDALISRDFERAYGYLSPGYRKLFPVDGYISRFGNAVIWQGVDVEQVVINSESAKVVVGVSYQLAMPPTAGMFQKDEMPPITKNMNELWLWRDGEWWFVDFVDFASQ